MSRRPRLFLAPIPWLFLALLAYIGWAFILPALQHGALYAYPLAAIYVVVLLSFGLAAVTVTRDIFAGRYP